MCNCRKGSSSTVKRTVIKKTSTSGGTAPLIKRTGSSNGRRIITRKIK